MAIICPTVLAADSHAFRSQMERIEPFAKRLQIDLTDGTMTPGSTVSLEQVWWPPAAQADLHLMYERPLLQLKHLVDLKPHLVIVHAEAEGNFLNLAKVLHKYHIKVGVAVLPNTPLESIKPALDFIDHLLIFSGSLGSFGGQADLELLSRVKQSKKWKPKLEVGWDGGINDQNIRQLADGGVDVLNVGGFIQKAPQPLAAYAKLKVCLR